MVEMKLNDEPFYQIKNGEKTIEIRLYDEKRKKLQVGDFIRFVRKDNNEEFIKTCITSLRRFDSFKDLFLSDLFEKTGFGGYSIEKAVKKMYEYYSYAEEERYGVLAIGILRL